MTRPTHTERTSTLEKEKAALWRRLCAHERAVEQTRNEGITTTKKLRRAGRHHDADTLQYDLRRTLYRLNVEGMALERSYNRARLALDDARRAARRGAR